MSVLQGLRTGVQSLRDFWGDRQDRKDREALQAKRRFKLASSWDETGEHESRVREMDAVLHSGRFEQAELLYRRAFAEGQTLQSTYKLYDALVYRLYDPPPVEPAEQELYVQPFREAFARAPTSFTAGLLASAFRGCASASRGGDAAAETTDEQWAGYRRNVAQARLALDAHPDRAGTCPVWRRADYELALDEAPSRDAFDEAFERVWQLDRTNLVLCADHGVMLLPRWMGSGPEDLESFARRAASLTQQQFGWGAYSFIHSRQAGVGHHDAVDTLCDLDLVTRGFEDLLQRFPDSQSLLNRYAMTLDWLEDYAGVYRIQKRIHTVNPEIWSWSASESFGLENALDAFLIARESAVADRFEQ